MKHNPKNKQQSYFQNWLSVLGGISSAFSFGVLLFLFIVDFFAKEGNPYLGVITYLIAPIFLIISLILIPLGAWIERSRRHKRGYAARFPRIDFNNPTHQKWALTTIGVVTLFLLFSVVGAYKAYEFTESTTFCGQVCHQVMEPEFTAYQNSPHARVSCVQCHIGPGVDWYVRSKFSGAYQVYSVAANRYSRPIETPIKDLRPAQETCEQCHWPQQFFGAVEQDHVYFLSDEKNTAWKTRMLMFVGGGTPPYGKREGIHWHMNIKNKIYYISTDKERQVIPWIKKIDPKGSEEIFVSKGSGFSAENPPEGEMRVMDCMDCHNRPTHIFESPADAVNEAMAYGVIDRSLPFIKREAVKALVGEYASHEEAEGKIPERLESFYTKKYPGVLETQKTQLEESIQAVVEIYKRNFFPAMNVSWKEYPSNLGHFDSPGCFRCHDEQHKSDQGKTLQKDCSQCHAITAQGPLDALETSLEGLEFKHPEDISEMWREMNCFECHTGE